MENKTDLRIWAKSLRKTLPLDAISAKIVRKIRQNPEFQQAKNVLLYSPSKYEINLLALLEEDKKLFLPKVNGKELLICPFKKGDALEISSFNIKEPCSNPVDPCCLDLAIVPALAADKNCFRLGYGGGFYDRFLAQNKVKTITPAARQLLVEKLPVEKFDVPVDFVITD